MLAATRESSPFQRDSVLVVFERVADAPAVMHEECTDNRLRVSLMHGYHIWLARGCHNNQDLRNGPSSDFVGRHLFFSLNSLDSTF